MTDYPAIDPLRRAEYIKILETRKKNREWWRNQLKKFKEECLEQTNRITSERIKRDAKSTTDAQKQANKHWARTEISKYKARRQEQIDNATAYRDNMDKELPDPKEFAQMYPSPAEKQRRYVVEILEKDGWSLRDNRGRIKHGWCLIIKQEGFPSAPLVYKRDGNPIFPTICRDLKNVWDFRISMFYKC